MFFPISPSETRELETRPVLNRLLEDWLEGGYEDYAVMYGCHVRLSYLGTKEKDKESLLHIPY